MFWLSRRKTIKQYKESQAAFGNPLMGYVPSARYNEVSEDISLLYMDITWVELEPEEGVYNWASIDEENQISRWRKEGKHLVFRFVCDIPSDEEHMDIPEWLYEKISTAISVFSLRIVLDFIKYFRFPKHRITSSPASSPL